MQSKKPIRYKWKEVERVLILVGKLHKEEIDVFKKEYSILTKKQN